MTKRLFENFFRTLAGDKRFSEEEKEFLLKRASNIENSFEFNKAAINEDVKLVDFLHDRMRELDKEKLREFGWSDECSIKKNAKAFERLGKEKEKISERIKEKLTLLEKEKLALIEEGLDRELELMVAFTLKTFKDLKESTLSYKVKKAFGVIKTEK